MSEQLHPKKVVIQEAGRPAQCVVHIMEGEDLSATNRLLAQLRAASPSAKKQSVTRATDGGAGSVKKKAAL